MSASPVGHMSEPPPVSPESQPAPDGPENTRAPAPVPAPALTSTPNFEKTGRAPSQPATATAERDSTPTPASSPRRSTDFGGPGHTRGIRLAAVLRSCSEQPDLLFDLLGIEMIAETLALPVAAVQRMVGARASVRRRFARRLRDRLGLSLDHLEAARTLPDDPQDLLRAARLFAVAIRLSGTRRVMSRVAFQALIERFGADAVAFGFAQQAILGRHAEALAEFKHDDVPNLTDLRLFVRSLAAQGNGAAAIVALKLSVPVTLATAPVANLDLALETGLPQIAAAALAAVEAPTSPEDPVTADGDDLEAWEADRSDGTDDSSGLDSGSDSTEAA